MPKDRAYYQQRARQYAQQEGLDPNVFARQISQESGFNPAARSGAGAVGIAQIVPKWHPEVDPTNPDASLHWAAHYMATMVKKYGNYKDALSVYNSGRPFKIGRGIEETRNYVQKILAGGIPASTASNQNAASKVSTGDNTAFGAPASRPRALSAYLLTQAERLSAGGQFDMAGLAQAMQADKAQAVNAASGIDPGGTDPSDPRVKMELTTGLGVKGKVIGTPGHGTHTLGNWESDRAIDEALPYGTPVRAPFGGVIGNQFGALTSSKDSRFAGLRVHVMGDQDEAYLAHLSRFAPGIKPGTRVKPGQVIGYSGAANGVNHLHEALKSGNPYSLIPRT